MTADEFAAWVENMKASRGWSGRECSRRLGCGQNQIARWCKTGTPLYIKLACKLLMLSA